MKQKLISVYPLVTAGMTVNPPADDVISHQESAVVLDGGKLNLAGNCNCNKQEITLDAKAESSFQLCITE